MDRKQALLDRLSAIGRSLEQTGQALALLGLGSVGAELDRLDAYSDLDFFAIVKDGQKGKFLADLDWLQSVYPVAYYFKNTVDGYKALFADGIFCEFAVFEPHELSAIPFTAGRIIWKDPGFDDTSCRPRLKSANPDEPSVDWMLGEALTNLYVGLCRYHRGEKLSAARFIQVYAVDHIINLSPHIDAERPSHADVFAHERRYEERFP